MRPQYDFANWLTFDDPDGYSRVRDLLMGADYTTQGVLKILGRQGDSVPTDRHLFIRQSSDGRPIDTLIRVFLAGISIDQRSMREALAPMSLESWVKAGLLIVEGDSVSSPFTILPLHPFTVAFDKTGAGGGMASDFVMGIGSSTQNMISLMIHRKAKLALDLGAGCGALAFFRSRSADKVIATDRNPRAVRLARFNAGINGLSNVESREGDLFEPVRDLKFDHIISNAPFVITPSSGYLYLDGGMQGDQFVQRLVRGAAELLNEQGYCQFLCNWAHFQNQDWVERLAGWFQGIGCDVWALHGEILDASAYAHVWIGHFEGRHSPNYTRLYNEWMDYYEREKIEAVSMGFITMRRASDRQNWFHLDKEPKEKSGELGSDVVRFFEARDFLGAAASQGNGLMDAVLMPSPELRLDIQCQPDERAWRPLSHHLRLAKGLRFEAKTDPLGCDFIARCDGKRTVGELLREIAASSGLSPDNVLNAGAQVVRQFVERGFLLPVQLPGAGSSGSV